MMNKNQKNLKALWILSVHNYNTCYDPFSSLLSHTKLYGHSCPQ